MAALRRLVATFANISKGGTNATGKQASKKGNVLKYMTAGSCVSAGAGIAYYFYGFDVRRSGSASYVEARVLHLALPSVSASDKVGCVRRDVWHACTAPPSNTIPCMRYALVQSVIEKLSSNSVALNV